jgi:hypothetical protein
MATSTQERGNAKTRGLSLFPAHEAIVEEAAKIRGLEGNTFSPAIQFIIKDWAILRGITPAHSVVDARATAPLSVFPHMPYAPQGAPPHILHDNKSTEGEAETPHDH